MASWLNALARTRDRLAGAISKVFSRAGRVDAVALEALETDLILADIPTRIVASILDELRDARCPEGLSPREHLKTLLANALHQPEPAFNWKADQKPLVILVVGINGSGKTTSCAKLARQAQLAGLTPLLGAGDTFRAAGSDQLKLWANRIQCDVVAGATGADGAAVAFDAVQAAEARGRDVLIMDTAGRMHTKAPLMDELQKVRRAMCKKLPGAPHETWIVLDASMGQNAISQARQFHAAVPLTGVVVAKLDGSAKAGFIFAIRDELKLPIRFVGLGEGMDDLAPFDAQAFAGALLGLESAYAT